MATPLTPTNDLQSDRVWERQGWATKVLILAGGPAVGMAVTGISSALPKIQEALATTSNEEMLVKLMIGITGGAAVIGSPLVGYLSDKIGLKRVLIGIYALFTIAGTAGLYVHNIPLLTAMRFLCGLAGAGAVTASIIIINKRLAPDKRPAWFGYYIAVAGVTGILVHPIAGFLTDISWPLVFTIYFLGLPLTAIALVWFKDAKSDVAVAPSARADAVGETKERLWQWFPFRFALIGLLMGCVVYLPVIYIPFQLKSMGVDSAGKVSLVLMADAMACVCLAAFYGRARKYLSEWGAFAFAFTMTGVGGIIASTASSYAVVMVGMTMAGFGIAWFMPNLMTMVGARVQPHQQGRAAGLVKAANYLSTPLCVMAAEPLGRILGVRFPVMLSGLIALVLLAVALYQLARQRGASARASTDPAQVEV